MIDPYDLTALAAANKNPWQQPLDPLGASLWHNQQRTNGMLMQAMHDNETRLAALVGTSIPANARETASMINASMAAREAEQAAARNQVTLDLENQTVTVAETERLKPTKKDLIKFVFDKLVAKKTRELDERRAIEKKMDTEIDALKDEQKSFIKELVKEEVGHVVDQINVLLKTKFPKTQLNLRFYNYNEKIEVSVNLEGATTDQIQIEETEAYKQKTADLIALIEKKQKILRNYKDITQRVSTLVHQHNPSVTTIIDAACSSFTTAEIESLNNILLHLDVIIHKQWEPDFEEDTFFTEHPIEATIECEVIKPDKVTTAKDYFYD